MNRALPLDPTPERFGAAMARRFGPMYHLLGLGRALGRTRLEDHAAEMIRDAASAGPIVYVLPRASTLDHLALNAALASRHLPLSVWAPRVGTTTFLPLADVVAQLRYRFREFFTAGPAPDPVATRWIVAALRAGKAISWFVDDRPRWFQREPMAFDGLVPASELTPSVQVIPLMVVWDRSPEVSDPVRRFFLGKQGVPGLLWRFWRAFRSADAFVHVGRPVDLLALRERVGPDRLPGVLRRVLARSLRDERRLVHGPRLMPHRSLKRLVLHNPPIRTLAKEEAERRAVSVDIVDRELSKTYDKIAANFSWTTIQFLHLALRPLWTRVFSGVDVRPLDIERIRNGMRDGAVVLVPCHKSHFDYVLLSWVLYDHDLIVPHVVAGMNLAVWPISVILRGAGGFFIRRAFTGDRVFPTVFSRYLRELLRQEYPVEFFIEGGRTRSGKLLQPKLGVLRMVLDAAELRSHAREVTILPIGLAYEQVAEEGAYARELGGEKKRPETFGELIRARSVLRRRFGRVYLRVGEPIACSSLVDAQEGVAAWSDRPSQERDQAVDVLGRRIIHDIGHQIVLLPTSLVATALLAVPRRAVRHTELTDRIRRFDQWFNHLGAPRAQSLSRFEQGVAQALDRFVRDGRIQAMENGGERLWSIVPDERITLDYYKNQVVHLFAPASLAAAALRPDARAGAPSLEPVLARFSSLLRLLRREFVLDPALVQQGDAAVLERGIADLVAFGAVVQVDGQTTGSTATVSIVDEARISEVYGLLRPLLEGYAAALDAGPHLPATREALCKSIVTDLPRRQANGTVTRPESLSLATLQNAVATLVETGVFKTDDPRDKALTLSFDKDAAAAVLSWLSPMVAP